MTFKTLRPYPTKTELLKLPIELPSQRTFVELDSDSRYN